MKEKINREIQQAQQELERNGEELTQSFMFWLSTTDNPLFEIILKRLILELVKNAWLQGVLQGLLQNDENSEQILMDLVYRHEEWKKTGFADPRRN